MMTLWKFENAEMDAYFKNAIMSKYKRKHCVSAVVEYATRQNLKPEFTEVKANLEKGVKFRFGENPDGGEGGS